MSRKKFEPDYGGIAELLLMPGTKAVIRATTESLARSAAAGAATSSKFPSWTVAQPGGSWTSGSTPVAAMRVEYDTTDGRPAKSGKNKGIPRRPKRFRGVVIVQHPTPSGRKAGREALRRAVPDPAPAIRAAAKEERRAKAAAKRKANAPARRAAKIAKANEARRAAFMAAAGGGA